MLAVLMYIRRGECEEVIIIIGNRSRAYRTLTDNRHQRSLSSEIVHPFSQYIILLEVHHFVYPVRIPYININSKMMSLNSTKS